jgi:hypothetical protein
MRAESIRRLVEQALKVKGKLSSAVGN